MSINPHPYIVIGYSREQINKEFWKYTLRLSEEDFELWKETNFEEWDKQLSNFVRENFTDDDREISGLNWVIYVTMSCVLIILVIV